MHLMALSASKHLYSTADRRQSTRVQRARGMRPMVHDSTLWLASCVHSTTSAFLLVQGQRLQPDTRLRVWGLPLATLKEFPHSLSVYLSCIITHTCKG